MSGRPSLPQVPPRLPLQEAAAPFSLSDCDFERLRRLALELTGIALGPGKRTMLEARLSRRLRALGLRSFGEYYRLLERQGPADEERVRFVNALTTNKTEFFREAHHFAFLREQWAPARRRQAAGLGSRVRLWSAGCSSGEEPYSIAMTLLEALGPAWDFRILASDIDTEVLARAQAGIYTREELARVPVALRRRYFVPTAGPERMRIRPEVQARVVFRQINLLAEPWPIRTRFEIIFCRNVLIYFDRATQRRVVERFARVLAPSGLLVLGHSESLLGLATGFTHLGGTIYRRIESAESP
ncbi:MAG: protein-glutamate O-methyltransferase [Armatimonadota bacterium]|nr:protein-glutamate O-methyltransferase [Armatimonadota bacterium]MDR7553905.1 protein-glutamate O-methyltransferase [Armatimonadota bacterium]MDR7574103.1 protein-glutamate O-methyltransferase [Armatimonadota bacterium]